MTPPNETAETLARDLPDDQRAAFEALKRVGLTPAAALEIARLPDQRAQLTSTEAMSVEEISIAMHEGRLDDYLKTSNKKRK